MSKASPWIALVLVTVAFGLYVYGNHTGFPVAVKAEYYDVSEDGRVTVRTELRYATRWGASTRVQSLINARSEQPDTIEVCRLRRDPDLNGGYYLEDDGIVDTGSVRDCDLRFVTNEWYDLHDRYLLQRQQETLAEEAAVQ